MTQDANSEVMQKTRELCEMIIARPEFRSIQARVDAFAADTEARELYESIVEKSEELQGRQESGQPIDDGEMESFDGLRKRLVENPVARAFMEAREEAHDMQMSVRRYISKTFELGRLPGAEDLEGGCGSHGCGCHH